MITRRRHTQSSYNQSDSNHYSSQASHRSQTFVTENNPGCNQTYQDTQDTDMTCRDRTNEFMSAVKSMQSRQMNGYVQNSRKDALQQRSEFMQIARKIGRDLANTFAKLEKMSILAKRKSLFDDKPEEIQQLTFIIKQDIGSLNKQIAQLQELSKAQRRGSSKHKQTHSNTVVVALQQKLATMSNDFKSVLELRTENMKQQKVRREEFSQSSPVSSTLPPSALAGHTGSVLLSDDLSSRSKGDVAIDMDNMSEGSRYQQQLQLIEEQDSYIQGRSDTMQNIETIIVELGGIFQQLATMVNEQEEMVQRIDANVEDTQLNVEAAHSEILKYFQSVTSNRWLMIKIFGVLIVFFIIFVVFMA